MNAHFRRVIMPAALLALLAGVALAEDAPPPQSGTSGCEIRLAPIFFWAPINTTSASDAEDDDPVDVTEGESGLNGAFAARVEVLSGPSMFSVEELYASISYDTSDSSGEQRSLDFTMSLFELYGGREVVDSFSIYGGVRYYSGDLEYTATTTPSIDLEASLLDPVVGVWYRPRLSKSWTAAVSADLGGFTVGFDWSSSVSAVFSWQPGEHFGLNAGYRALYMRKDDDSGFLETTFYGPVFGMEIVF